jgi:prepilin-type N-terminal cleavage/methylation domain-containing protein
VFVTIAGLTRPRARFAARLRDEQGYTLIELLVTMAAGLVVLAGLVTVLTVTLQQTTRTFTLSDATENARNVVAHIEDELHSACLTNGVTPIQGGGSNGTQDSDANDLVFVSQFGTSANPTPVEHKITYSPTNGTLTEYTYPLSTGSPSDPTGWLFSATPTNSAGKRLLANVAPLYQASTKTYIPIFQYFAYEPYTDANGNTDTMLMDGTSSVPGTTTLPNPDPLPTTSGLSATNAAAAAEVQLNFVVGASGGNNENTNLVDTNDPVTDAIVLRFTPPADTSDGGSTPGPCA